MLIKTPKYKIFLKNLALNFFHKIENNGNFDSNTNGEFVFINNLLNRLKAKNRGVIIFDVGANKGAYTEQLMLRSKHYHLIVDIHAFEPTRECVDELLKKFGGVEHIVINDFGLSNVKTEQTIYYDREKSGLASLYERDIEYYKIKLDKHETVSLVTGEEYIENKQITHIDFLKVDVEGHELKVLNGFGKYLRSDFIDFIQFEYGGTNLDAGTKLWDFYKLLESKGFLIGKIMPKGLELRKYHPRMENFNYSNYVAISKEVLES